MAPNNITGLGSVSGLGAFTAVAPPPADAGYFAGGLNPSFTSSTEKISFYNEVTSNLASSLSTSYFDTSGMANSGVAGYIAGNTTTTAINKLSFSSEEISVIVATLSKLENQLSAFANSGTAGYFSGGTVGSGDSERKTDKITFSNDSRTVLAALLGVGRKGAAGFANSGTAGYIAGGRDSGNNWHTTIDKITFSNDSRSSLGAVRLSTTRIQSGSFANSGTAGYVAGGYNQSFSDLSSIDKITFSNDSSSTLGIGLSSGRTRLAGASKSGTAGYFAGGEFGTGPTRVSVVQKLAFSNDSMSTVSATLSSLKSRHASFANSGTL